MRVARAHVWWPLAAGAATSLAFALACAPSVAFEFNGRFWDEMPVKLWVDPERLPPGVPLSEALNWVESAASLWNQVSCSTAWVDVEVAPAGGWAADGIRSIFWLSEGWLFLPSAAGATLWIPTPPGAPQEVDIALNAEHYAWIVGGGDALQSGVVDPVSVLAHELGHVLGLAHSAEPHATMFQALLPNGTQSTLDADDAFALCTLYPDPTAQSECIAEPDCGPGLHCAELPPFAVCSEVRDSPGAPCNKEWLNCEGLCLLSLWECSQICAFTAQDYSDGYCAPLCGAGHPPCPAGWTCHPVADWDAAVCFPDAEPERPEPDVREESEEGERGDVDPRPEPERSVPGADFSFRAAVAAASSPICPGDIAHLAPSPTTEAPPTPTDPPASESPENSPPRPPPLGAPATASVSVARATGCGTQNTRGAHWPFAVALILATRLATRIIRKLP